MSSSSCAFSKTFFATFLLICWILSLHFCTFLWWTWKQSNTFEPSSAENTKASVCLERDSAAFEHLFLERYRFLHVGDLLSRVTAVAFLGEVLKREEMIPNKIHLMFYVVRSKNVWTFNDLRMDLFIDQALSRAYTMSGSCLPHLSTGTWTFSKRIWPSDLETFVCAMFTDFTTMTNSNSMYCVVALFQILQECSWMFWSCWSVKIQE